jgi:predicted phosphodiesterase
VSAYRLAVISDVHGDIAALRAALRAIEGLGCDSVVCAGDLVGGVADDEVVDLVRSSGIPCVCGNHDRWAVERAHGLRPGAPMPLAPSSIDWLAKLPAGWEGLLAGVRVAVRHGSPRCDMDVVHPAVCEPTALHTMLEKVGADVLLVGHSHESFAVAVPGGGLVASPGALLRDLSHEPTPFTGATRGGSFGVLELPASRFTVHQAG